MIPSRVNADDGSPGEKKTKVVHYLSTLPAMWTEGEFGIKPDLALRIRKIYVKKDGVQVYFDAIYYHSAQQALDKLTAYIENGIICFIV